MLYSWCASPWFAVARNFTLRPFLAPSCSSPAQVVNIGATDIINAASEHKEYLVLGLIWQARRSWLG